MDSKTTFETEAPQPSDGGRWRRIAAIAAAIVMALAVLAVAAVALARWAGGSGDLDVEPGIPVAVAVAPGSSARTIATAMEEAGVVAARALRDEIDRRGVGSQLQAGSYDLVTGMTAAAVVDELLAGPSGPSASSVTVREGATIAEVVEGLAAETGIAADGYRAALLDGTVTSPYLPESAPGADPLAAWEGLLFPARYEIAPGEPPATTLQRMADEMVNRVERLDWSRLDELGVSRYEALVVASLIEREAGVEEDRPLIASVIYNRLAADMPLQIDATVIYALGENPGRVLAEHLEIDSPYNTYRNRGLPPTAIGTIRQTSLEAAVDPAATDYLFYVLVAADGTHGFSATYEEHQEKVNQAREDGILP